jgi:hypothetical protein
MKHPSSLELYAYWNQLRGGRAAPERGDIDPAEIRAVLADTLMIEVDQSPASRTAFPIRLAGTRVNALFGTDLKGRSLTSLWRLQDRRDIAALAAAVMDDTRPLVAGAIAAPPGEPSLSLELLLLPLRYKGRTHARLLGALSAATVPSWLGLIPVAPLVLVSHRMIDVRMVDRRSDAMQASRETGGGVRYGSFVIYDGGRA